MIKTWLKGASVPEHSAAGRLAVLASAAVANLALMVTAGATLTALASLCLVALGHWVSWRGRHRKRTLQGQLLLGVLLLACVTYLGLDLLLAVFGGALPQAKFAVAAQAVTSFDLKSRRNLFAHLWHSAVILYVAALFAWDPSFLPFAVLWALAFFAFLVSTRRGGGERAPARVQAALVAQFQGNTGAAWPWIAAWLALSAALFLALPRFSGRPLAVPLLVSIPLSQPAAGEVLPAVLPLVGAAPGGGGEQGINLRVRGRLGDEVMFRVRAPAASYWRAYVLEDYQRQAWAKVAHRANPISAISVNLPVRFENTGQGPGLPQTYYIEKPLPAEVLASYPLRDLYFPARELVLVSTGTVHSPYGLRKGVNYAAVSQVRDTSPANLRRVSPLAGTDIPREDVALPAGIPTRVQQLTDTLVAGKTTEYDRVAAITAYLRDHYRYSLDTPRLPSGADATDRFLFDDHVGFCEQFATALAVMLRQEGIPSRVAIGYSTGDRDPFTASFTVHARDAHAWVEVLFPGVGWVPFDASPGFNAEPTAQRPPRWFLSDFSPQVALASLGTGRQASIQIGAAAVLLLGAATWLARRRRPRRAAELRAYLGAMRWLRLGALPVRAAYETPGEHLVRVHTVSIAASQALLPLVDALMGAVYGSAAANRGGESRRDQLAARPRIAIAAMRYRWGRRVAGAS